MASVSFGINFLGFYRMISNYDQVTTLPLPDLWFHSLLPHYDLFDCPPSCHLFQSFIKLNHSVYYPLGLL